MVNAICAEIRMKKDRISARVGSIYFGGGTPSVLPYEALAKIFDTISSTFTIANNAEITLEANPDDLTPTIVNELRKLPINRFSIGVQSFFEEDLKWMNRAHNAVEAESCIKRSQDAGFENLSIDLIYGYPLLTDVKWTANIEKAVELQSPHLSAYALTVEAKTALAHAIKMGKQPNVNDEQSARQFLFLNQQLTEAGFDTYEISNYALPGHHAVHNTNYWKGIPYLGIGPSAHGFDGIDRFHNISNNATYLYMLGSGQLPETIEKLTTEDRFNEYVMTTLRTMWGIDLEYVGTVFGQDYIDQLQQDLQPSLKKNHVSVASNRVILTPQGKLFADGIAASLFSMNE